jgi:hypothetical protein
MSGMPVIQESATVLSGGQSQKVDVTTSSAQSTAITTPTVLVTSTVSCFIRQGTNPTALSNGTDQYIPANTTMRLVGITSGNKIAVIGTGSGALYISPGA